MFMLKEAHFPSACCIFYYISVISLSQERSGGVQGQVDALKQVLDSFIIPADLRWTWGQGGTEKTLEKSWTDLVHSHEVWMNGRDR